MVMANGRILQSGSADEVESVLQTAYLGSVEPAEAGPPAQNGASAGTDAPTVAP